MNWKKKICQPFADTARSGFNLPGSIRSQRHGNEQCQRAHWTG